ncbi:MAG TPA: heavy metal translocating P-type ATPase [Bacteroidia bacterium]|nr:heavy metal translocating P-type ATPase [Bacteroidia bacterium]
MSENESMSGIETVNILIEDLRSEHCAQLIEIALAKIEGMDLHQVELNNKRAKIGGKILSELIVKAVKEIRSLGYNVISVRKKYPVLSMTCASCANSTQQILAMQKGVISASVNYANALADIEYIPSICDPKQLQEAMRSGGYDLMIEENENAKDNLHSIQEENFRKLKIRTFASLAFSVPLVIIGMTPAFMNWPVANLIMWLLASPVVIWFGKQFFIGAYKQMKHRSANMDTLIALSTGVAYIFSVFNTLFPHYWHAKGLHAHVYFESSAVVISFILLGKLLEEKAKGKTGSALKKLIGLQPKSVTRINSNGEQKDILIKEIELGDSILVKPGEKIAVDGVVLSGTSYVDESMISGEPVAIEKKAENKVFAGTINQKGSFVYKAEKIGSNTLLAQIIKMVEDAQGSRAPVQKTVDKIASVFVPIVIAISLLSFACWLFFGKENELTHGLLSMITVLVIACPCALGLATPTAIMVGIGKGAEAGILIKDAESLETAKKITAIVLDKTGTITEGKPEVTEMKWIKKETKELKDLLYTIERSSEHPLADAIVNTLKNDSSFIEGVEIENISGKGIMGTSRSEKYFIGNMDLMKEEGILFDKSIQEWTDLKISKANTVIFFSNEKELIAVISIADKIKPSSIQAIRLLQEKGIEVYMLTGDNAGTAKAVAEQVGIRNYKANVLPSDKAAFIKELQLKGKILAMVGDGINDSNALAQADVSIAMGKGSDIAMDVAKMTIISSDLRKITDAIRLSSITVNTVRQNLFWAFIYNLIGIPLAAGILYPVNGFLLDPMIAGGAMALSSVSVVSNSLLLKFKKI